MTSSSSRVSVLFLALLGCSPELSLPMVSVPAARSAVVVFQPDQGEPAAWAFDFPSGPPEYLTVPSAEPGQAYVLSFTCSLAAVGLPAGRSRPDSGGTALPLASQAVVGRVSGGSAPEWTITDPASEVLRSFLFRRQPPSRCREFVPSQQLLGGRFMSAARLGDSEIVVALYTGIQIHQLPTMTRLEQWAAPLGIEPRGAARDGAGWVYLAGAAGTIDIISPDHQRMTLTATTGTTSRSLLRTYAAVPTTPGQRADELFMASENGRVEHWDGRRWELLYYEPQPAKGKAADIVWTGPGQAQAVGVASNRVLEISGTTVVESRVLDREGILARILFHPTYGRLFFTANGRLVLSDGSGGYVEHVMTAIGQRTVSSAVATEDGFMAGAYIGGQVEQYIFGAEECPPVLVDLQNIEQLVTLDGGFLVFGDGFDDESYVVSMTPKGTPERCQ